MSPPWYYYTPFHPAFYMNPPVYYQGAYYSGGFNFGHLILGLIALVFVFWLIGRFIIGRQTIRYTHY
jgi:hypothetical protein